jgi:hypothetical protein
MTAGDWARALLRRGEAGRGPAGALERWATARGWTVGHTPPREFAGGIDRVLPGETLLLATAGDHAGRRCAALLYERPDRPRGGVTDRYVACLVLLPAPLPGLRIRRRYGFAGGPPNPPPPDPTDPTAPTDPADRRLNRRFDRRLRVEPRGDPGGARLLTGPVRAAVLRLDAAAPRGDDLVLVGGRTLRTVVDAGPGGLDPDAVLSRLAELADRLAERPAEEPR